jgi:hypothetical protein
MATFVRRLALAVALAPAPLVFVACGLDTSGLEPTDVEPEGGVDANGIDAEQPDVRVLDGTGGTDGADAADARDTSPPPDGSDGCASSVEICDNGVDDDCDGKIDCADPQCSAWTCVGGPIPANWALAELTSSTTSACSANYSGPPVTLYGGTFPAATCECSGTLATPGSCKSGTFTVSGNSATAPTTCTGFSAPLSASNGACTAFMATTPMASQLIEVVPAPYTPGTCMPTPTKTVPPIEPTGQSCALTGSGGGGCMNQGGAGVCVPALSSGYDACIVRGGILPCPTGIGFDHQYLVGIGTDDTRGCSDCTSTGPTATCTNAELTLYTDSMCTTSGAVIQANSACAPIPVGGAGTPTYTAEEYSAVVHDETCGASPVTPTGSVSVTGPLTYCCH